MKTQEEVEINKIKEVDNPREELGDLTELTASIREIGIVEPLIVDKDYKLIAEGDLIKELLAADTKGKVPKVLQNSETEGSTYRY